MPTFHFNVYDGVDIIDKLGQDLTDLNAARRVAIRYAGTLLDDAGKKDSLGKEWRMEVTDAVGLLLFRLDFLVTDAPAAEGRNESDV